MVKFLGWAAAKQVLTLPRLGAHKRHIELPNRTLIFRKRELLLKLILQVWSTQKFKIWFATKL